MMPLINKEGLYWCSGFVLREMVICQDWDLEVWKNESLFKRRAALWQKEQ
jgi:hypothetical protein